MQLLPLCCVLACGPAQPTSYADADAGPDQDADDVADADGDGDAGADADEIVEPCDDCPDSCVLGRCAADTCEQALYVAVSATAPHSGALVDLDLEGAWLYAVDRATGLLVYDAADPERLELSATVELPDAYSVDVTGDEAYVLSGGEVHVVDVSDPSAPEAGVSVPVWGSEARVLDDLLVVTGGDRTQLLDLTDRRAPILAGELLLPEASGGTDHTRGAARMGSTLLVGVQSGGVAVVDIGDPTAPSLVEVVPVEWQVNDLSLDGDELLVATEAGLRSFDVGDPRAPVETARFASLEGGRVTSIVLWGDAVLALAGQATLIDGAPAAETLLRSPGFVTDAVTTDRWALLSTSDAGLHTIELDAGRDGARRLPVEDGPAVALALGEGRLFVGLGGQGLEVWDLGALPEVVPMGSMATPTHDLFLSGELLAISAGTELTLADAETLEVLSTVPVPAVGHVLETTITSMWIEGPMVFVAANALTDGLLMTVDASDPASPEVVYSEPLEGADQASALAASGGLLFVAHEGGGGGRLAVYDVAEPSSPEELGRATFDESLFFRALAPAGDHLFVAASSLMVFDVADPSHPRLVGGWEGRALSLTLDGALLYTADYAGPSQGLNVLDASDPASPVLSFNYPLEIAFPALRAEVVVAARFALISTGTSSLTMIPVCR